MKHPPICPAHGVFMHCKQNGHVVGFKCGRRYDSDLFACPECGARVALLAPEHHPEPLPLNAEPVRADTMMRGDQ